MEKSNKFPKILIYLELPECEFRLAWLCGKDFRSRTCSMWTWFENEENEDLDLNSNQNQVHLPLIHNDYMRKKCSLYNSGYSDTRVS
jgi:hypothetical protein